MRRVRPEAIQTVRDLCVSFCKCPDQGAPTLRKGARLGARRIDAARCGLLDFGNQRAPIALAALDDLTRRVAPVLLDFLASLLRIILLRPLPIVLHSKSLDDAKCLDDG